MVGRKPYSVPSLIVTVASPLSGAVSSCVLPSGNVTLIVTTGADDWATAKMPISATKHATRTPFAKIPELLASEDFAPRRELLVVPSAPVTGRYAVNLVCVLVADQ